MAHVESHHHAPHRGAGAPTPSPKEPPAPPPTQHLPPNWSPQRFVPSLPIGVALLAIAIAATGIVLFLSGALIFLNIYSPDSIPTNLLILPAVDAIGASILLLTGTVLVGLANALWHQERWALYLTVGVLFAAESYLFFTATITVLFVLLLLVFVYLLVVRQHFY